MIIPVYNRPQEMDELMSSIANQDYKGFAEVVIVEDGSTLKSDCVIEKYKRQLTIKYYEKENSGPGASRNYGMARAKGDYFIILDSDVILPKHYLTKVNEQLKKYYTDGFGGPDAAHSNFTPLQKAINYSMTSFLTTGGIRGKRKGIGRFQPRSFNMGISRKAFKVTNGFSDVRVGEDIDFTFRLWEAGFETQLIQEAFVYHKRRNTIKNFFKQTYAFGMARAKLNNRYPKEAKWIYWLPALFIIGIDISMLFFLLGYWQFITFYGFYFIAIFLTATVENKNLKVGFLSMITSLIQFLGYSLGFLVSQIFTKNNTKKNRIRSKHSSDK